jgi:hypothetical protein
VVCGEDTSCVKAPIVSVKGPSLADANGERGWSEVPAAECRDPFSLATISFHLATPWQGHRVQSLTFRRLHQAAVTSA